MQPVAKYEDGYYEPEATEDSSYQTPAQQRVRYGNNKKHRSVNKRKALAKISKASKARNRK